MNKLGMIFGAALCLLLNCANGQTQVETKDAFYKRVFSVMKSLCVKFDDSKKLLEKTERFLKLEEEMKNIEENVYSEAKMLTNMVAYNLGCLHRKILNIV